MEKHYKSQEAQIQVDSNPPTPLTVASKSSTSMTSGVIISQESTPQFYHQPLPQNQH